MAKEKVIFNQALHGDRLNYCIKQCSDHKAIVEGANEAVKELKRVAKDELGVEPKQFSELLKMYHKSNRDDFENQSEEILEMYDAIFTK